MPGYYPVHLDIRNKLCVVVGGGVIAERKVRGLLECGARVAVVSPQVSAGLERLSSQGQIVVVSRDFREGDLAGSYLVIAATDNGVVNAAVAAEAERQGQLLNVVDEPERCNFIVPSVVRRGDLAVAISTGGRSPALARKVRVQLEQILAPEYGSLLDLIADVRGELKLKGRSVDPEAWQNALDDELLDLVRQGKADRARERILTTLGN